MSQTVEARSEGLARGALAYLRSIGAEASVVRHTYNGDEWRCLLAPAPAAWPRLAAVLAAGPAMAGALGMASCTVTRQGGRLLVAMRRSPYSAASPRSPLAVEIGRTAGGAPVVLDLGSPESPHVALVSPTRTGKSELVARILVELARATREDQLSLILIDPKGDRSPLTERLAGSSRLLHPVISDPADAEAAVQWLSDEVSRREASGYDGDILLALDEYWALVEATGGSGGMLARSVGWLAGRAGWVGIHLLLVVNKATSQWFGGSLTRANIGCRIVGRVADADESARATGQDGLQAHRLGPEPGEFILVLGGVSQRFKCQPVTEAELAAVIRPAAVQRLLPLADAPEEPEAEPVHGGRVRRVWEPWELALAIRWDGGIEAFGREVRARGGRIGAAAAGDLLALGREVAAELAAHPGIPPSGHTASDDGYLDPQLPGKYSLV